MSGAKPFPMPGSVWRWTGDHTTPPSGPHTVSALAWAHGATWAVMDEIEPGYYVEAMMLSDAWVCDSVAPPAPLKPPALSWAQAVDIVKMLAPGGSIARQAAAVIRIAEGREAAPDEDAAPVDGGAPRPKVGTWQPDVEGHDRSELLYDDRGQPVGGYNPRSVPGFDWFAARPLLGPITGTAATPSLARCAILEVLKTWADVSAVETE